MLLVDDDPAILEGVADLLEVYGYTVRTATDGRSALDAMQQYRPDLVISDIMMPEMDGYKFFEAVRSNPAWTSIPFIFLTARGQSMDIRRGQSLGADAYLIKPFEPEDLIIAVDARLRRVSDIRVAAEAEVERMKQQIITIFSHELRTPLTYIYGYVNLLRDQHDVLDKQTMDEMIEGLYRGAERMVKLVEDLMLLVRIDSGVIEMEIALRQSTERVKTIVENVERELRPRAEERSIKLVSDVKDGVADYCVSLYLEDVLNRIVDNAIKFCRTGEGEVSIAIHEADGKLVTAVKDNGIGITPANQELIFERFQQVNRDTMEQQGIGLGLTLARSLTRLHGGDIVVESSPGAGSTFTITLPSGDLAAAGDGGCSLAS